MASETFMDVTRQGDVRGQHTYEMSDMKQLTVDTNADEADRFVAKNNEEVLEGEKQGREEGGSCLNTMPLFALIFLPHRTPAPGHAPYQLLPPQDKHAVMLRVLLLRFPLPTVLPARQATSVPPLTTPALLITAEPL